METTERTYENAVKLLRRGVDRDSANRWLPSIWGMKAWLDVLGHTEDDIKKLNIVHVAGTKGKGSTCVFLGSFLRAHGLRTGFPQKVGIYTSPDIRHIRERIQINGQPISESMFTKYVFELYDSLFSPEAIEKACQPGAPGYLQSLALLALHIFISENVDAAIFEAHLGGERDSTNVIQHPVATCITPIGMDHVRQLGPTIGDIAWQKSGIFKPGSWAFSALQNPIPTAVLKARAREKGVPLIFVPVSQLLPNDVKAISVPVQRANCSLALALAQHFLRQTTSGQEMTTEDIFQGVNSFYWPGRFETIKDQDGVCRWFIDGAHNEMSLKVAVKWFSESASKTTNPGILIFCFRASGDKGVDLAKQLAQAVRDHDVPLDHVIFTTSIERKDRTKRIDKLARPTRTPFSELRTIYSDIWNEFDPEVMFHCEPTAEEALDKAREIAMGGSGRQVLVTGSLHMVGSVLNLLGV